MLPRALSTAVAVLLTVPAAASATAYTVDATNGKDDCAGNVCKTFGEVAAKATSGTDTIDVKPGVYNEADPVTFSSKVAITATPYLAYLTSKTNKTTPLLSLAGGGSLTGLIVNASASQGPALGLGATATVTQSQLFAAASDATAVSIAGTAGSSTPVAITLDSVIAAPGKNGTAIDAASATGATAAALPGPAVTVTGTHVTAAGGAKPIALHGTVGLASASGDITGKFDQSILHGGGASTVTLDSGPLAGAAKGSLTITKSDTTDGGGTNVTVNAPQKHADSDLFASLPYHLKVGSPAIDQGGPADAGGKDVDGAPRQVGPASDLGADEFSNNNPVANLSVSATDLIPGQELTYDLSKSSDPDLGLGDSIAYLVSFGDGTGALTPTGSHAYAKPGTYTIRAIAFDRGNAVSNVATANVTVKDGTAPQVRITSPTANKVFSLKTSKGKPRQIAVNGTASDESGIAKVEVQLRRVSVIKAKAKKTRKAKAKAAAATCTYLVDGKRRIGTASCKKGAFFTVGLTKAGFQYKTKKDAGLKAGVYEATAKATDKNGNTATSTPVRFTLR